MSASKNCITCNIKHLPTSCLNSSTNPYIDLNKMITCFKQVRPIFLNLKPITKIIPKILHHTLHQNSSILPEFPVTGPSISLMNKKGILELQNKLPRIICLYHYNQSYATKIKIYTLYSYYVGYCIPPSRLMPNDNTTFGKSNLYIPDMISELSYHK